VLQFVGAEIAATMCSHIPNSGGKSCNTKDSATLSETTVLPVTKIPAILKDIHPYQLEINDDHLYRDFEYFWDKYIQSFQKEMRSLLRSQVSFRHDHL
jgi:hypothetical protein